MASLVRPAALALAAALIAPAAAHAQRAGVPSLFQLSTYAGYMVFGDMFDGPLGTTLSNANGAVYGAQVAVQLVPGVALVGNVAKADASLRVGVPFLGGYDVGESSVILYDAGVQIGTSLGDRTRLPVAPFLQAGVGGMRHHVRSGPLETDATNLAFNAGLGPTSVSRRESRCGSWRRTTWGASTPRRPPGSAPTRTSRTTSR